MIANDPALLNAVRAALAEEAAVPAGRAMVFLFVALAALAWVHRRPGLAAITSLAAGGLALGFWLVQIVSPVGFETDPSAARAWAQAGVTALAEPKGSGFVWGTEPGPSLVSTMAGSGIPLPLVRVAPQVVTLFTLLALGISPMLMLRNQTTGAFTATLLMAGGLWPGFAPYGGILLRPTVGLLVVLGLCVMVAMGRLRSIRRVFLGSRLKVAVGLIAIAALDQALNGGAQASVAAALLLCGATFILGPPLRVAFRALAHSALAARRFEALVLLCAFSGSGLFWWDPPRNVPGFREARDENLALQRAMAWMRANIPPSSVVFASPSYSASVAAFAGRRVLFPPPGSIEALSPLREPFRRARLVESVRLGRPIARLARDFSVTHLFLGPGEVGPPEGAVLPVDAEARLELVLVYQDVKDFRVFLLAAK
jgi:hypothetical protein